MSSAIRIYIVEDIAISRMSLENMLLTNNYELSGSAAKAEVAWEELQDSKTDLLLLDINLAGEKNGVWLAQKVRQYLNMPIVYLTAYGDQKTLKDVLDTKPNGYLMKPYQEPTLLTTITIALTNFLENKRDTVNIDNAIITDDFIFIKDRLMKIKLNIKNIEFVKSDGNYLEIRLEHKTHVVRNKLSDFKQHLPDDLFFQSHQRYLINISKIDTIGKDYIQINQHDIPISNKYKKTIESALKII
jgi:DNA-binding LytR/AlgR family response regulator